VVHGGVVVLGTAIQAGRLWVQFPMVPLELFIDIILPATLGSNQSLNEMSTRKFPGE